MSRRTRASTTRTARRSRGSSPLLVLIIGDVPVGWNLPAGRVVDVDERRAEFLLNEGFARLLTDRERDVAAMETR
jgi:hypothetical protein